MNNFDAIGKFSNQMSRNIEENLEDRTKNFHLGDGFETAVNSVLSTLLARQASLAIGMAQSPFNWSGHIAPLILRPMIDLVITMRWILKSPRERATEFINYGLGQEKLLTAHYQKRIQEGDEDPRLQHIVEANMNWIESQSFHAFVEINLGSWSGQSTRKMCNEIDDPDFYKFSFAPFSSCVHNTWNHVGKWNAKTCENPMHKRHSIGQMVEVWPIFDFVFRACKYLELAMDEFDGHYDYASDFLPPTEAFNRHIQELQAECDTSSEQGSE